MNNNIVFKLKLQQLVIYFLLTERNVRQNHEDYTKKTATNQLFSMCSNYFLPSLLLLNIS